jgi:hypothetical protein
MATKPIKKLKAGTAIFFRIELRDSTSDAHPLFSSASVPTILLRDSLGAVQVDDVQMTEAETGVYTYSHQTDTTDPIGVWQVRFKVISTVTVYTPEVDAFELIP